MQELNVKQSGIEKRTFTTSFYKTRNGKINKRVHELYLRNDIPCGLGACQNCNFTELKCLEFSQNSDHSKNAPFEHFLVLDGTAILKFIDILDDQIFRNVIIPQSSWNYVKKMNSAIYKRLNLIYQEHKDRFFVFLNEFVSETFVEPGLNRVPELYQECCLVRCASYLGSHWSALGVTPLIICSSDEMVDRLSGKYSNVVSFIEYVKGIPNCSLLVERLEDLSRKEKRGKALFSEHWTQDQLLDGISKGTLKKGKFRISPENYLEAFVEFDMEDQWFVQGRKNMNRAIHGDVVVVELLPQSEWTAPERMIRLRDAEENQPGEIVAEEDYLLAETDEDSEEGVSSAKKLKKDVLSTARVVGILRRNWRNYCGIIMPSNIPGGRQFLFAPSQRLIPRIRIETSHYDQLRGQKVLVQIDNWPQDSHYPKGHYVRIIGPEGDRRTEDEVILLEHEIPFEEFSPSVLACLPTMPWHPETSPNRKDLTHLDVCSVDPEGCTDIDDALHCIDNGNGTFEVGVHIADVTHFVRPGTALDLVASERSTTVYLCGRRIDMLPELLSSDLCSLRGEELRYAFSVIWTLDADVNVKDVKFCKSLIRSRAALTYQLAQEMVDDEQKFKDVIAVSLRNLLRLSRQLKAKRKLMGALELASSEIRFDVDRETGEAVRVQEKQHLATMSMVEEFMLLANIWVAERILCAFPDCAILRRHPVPTRLSFKPLITIAESCGFQLNVDTSNELAKSLDEVEAQCRASTTGHNAMVARMMRMMATRCMTQAVYFPAGTVPRDLYLHYGLAASVYTHFTSPIRRYADVMVHRLLATSIDVDAIHPEMIDRKRLIRLTENMNRRHRQAQYASRASILLNTFMMIKENPETAIQAIVIGIRNNGIQVMVPKYGMESVIYLSGVGGSASKATQEQMQELCSENNIHLFQEVKVSVAVVERDQRKRIEVKLVDPVVEGFSVVTNCEMDIPS